MNKKLKNSDTNIRVFKFSYFGEEMIYIIGIFSGFVSGFFGTGGGLLIHPSLTSILKLDEYKARGTTLITVFPAVLVASIFYANYNCLEIEKIVMVVVGGIIGGFIGASIMKRIPKFWLAITFDFFLVITSIKIIIQG